MTSHCAKYGRCPAVGWCYRLSTFGSGTPAPPEVTHVVNFSNRWAPERWPCDHGAAQHEFKAEGVVVVDDASRPADVKVTLSDGAGNVVASQHATLAAGDKTARLMLRCHLGDRRPEKLDWKLHLIRDGQTLTSNTGTVNVVSAPRVRAAVTPVVAARYRLRTAVEQLEQRELGAASRVTLTVLENFVPWVDADLAVAGSTPRGQSTCSTDGPEEARAKPSSRAGPISCAALCDQSARSPCADHRERRTQRRRGGPVLFTGYGHFSQVRKDVEKLPDTAQHHSVDFGPHSVCPEINHDRAIKISLCTVPRRDVSVNLLLSRTIFRMGAQEVAELALPWAFFNFWSMSPRALS